MSPIRVALVEDETDFAQVVAVLIRNSPGFEWAGHFGTMAHALKEIQSVKPDVVLVDLELPDGDGETCIRRLRKQAHWLRPVVLSKFDDSARIFAALVAGAFGYIHKGDGPRAMLDGIEAVARGQGTMSPSIARRAIELLQQQPDSKVANPEPLTAREQEIMERIQCGDSNKDIANRFGISPYTVANHLTGIYRKLHVRNRAEVMRFGKGYGGIPSQEEC